MPKSKKRPKKQTEESVPVTKNIAKTKAGKSIIVFLAFAFVGAIVAAMIYQLVQYMN